MGEIADDCRDGLRCQDCGGFMPDFLASAGPFETPGYPRSCADCEADYGPVDAPVAPRAARRSRRRRKVLPT